MSVSPTSVESSLTTHYKKGRIEFIPLVGSPLTDLPLILENTRSCPALTAPLAFLPFRHVSVQSAPFDRKRRVTLDTACPRAHSHSLIPHSCSLFSPLTNPKLRRRAAGGQIHCAGGQIHCKVMGESGESVGGGRCSGRNSTPPLQHGEGGCGGTNGDKGSSCGGSAPTARSGGGSAPMATSGGGSARQIPPGLVLDLICSVFS